MSAGTTDDVASSGVGERHLLTSIAPKRWVPSAFGVVAQDRIRRRPTDIVWLVVSLGLVVSSILATNRFTDQEARFFELFAGFPSWIATTGSAIFNLFTTGTVVVVLLALIVTRKYRLAVGVLVTGAATYGVALALRGWADADAIRARSGLSGVPDYPLVQLAVATSVLIVIGPWLVRPARRTVLTLVVLAAIASLFALEGLPEDIVGAFALGWAMASVFHLVFGTPAATPTREQVHVALEALGVAVDDLELTPQQVWGEARFRGRGPHGERVAIVVLGRDAADARLFHKFFRALRYRDSGPSLALTRTQQLEHRAYLLLLAARAGIPVSTVVIAGVAGPEEAALLVLTEPEGDPLGTVDPERVTDAVLDDVWTNLGKLHRERVSHGQMSIGTVLVQADGSTALLDFAHGSSSASADLFHRDNVELLATSAVIVGNERALAAAQRAIGSEGLVEMLPLLESAALSSAARKAIPDTKKFLTKLREEGAALAGEEVPKLTELRRVTPSSVIMAAATFLGFYLIVEQFVGVDLWATLQDAEWQWVLVAFLISPLPQFTGTVSLLGAVSARLPYGPVLGEQFANNFTGLIGGTLANTALVIRFFQKQGLGPAVAATSGVMNSLSAGIIQVTLVIFGLIVYGGDFTPSHSGSEDGGIEQLIILGIIVIGVGLGIAILIPRLRHLVVNAVKPQIIAGRNNLRDILTTPRKAGMMFGGNLASQVLYALVLDASLHAYGASLPLLQIIVINSLASVLGGMAPVPGGMGVVEAGMIAGLTAAGIPQSIAVAAVFTHRLFTAYLPPIYGWFALQWLRRNDYI
jgi:uncharacterized membrane protein YbhN (UPF0104 family)/tRNA A-37 threonylcarbamoyl transferase component Bud32